MNKFLSLTILCAGLTMPASIDAMTIADSTATQQKAKQKKVDNNPNHDKGLFNISKRDNAWFFEIPDSILSRPILTVTRYTATPSSEANSVFAGEECGQQTIYWEKSPDGKKLILRCLALYNNADTLETINRAVSLSNTDPIIAMLEIEKSSKKGSSKINITPLIMSDNVFSLGRNAKANMNAGGFMQNLSYIESVKSFPINTEVRSVRTYSSSSSRTPTSSNVGTVTLGLNTSFYLLPKKPMMPRLFDPRVGFFTDAHSVYSDSQQNVESTTFITRWRLEPREEDIEKMKNGELVEPKKPIVFYIDPATPKQWRKYLIAGVNDWQKAFEKAGFKNAIYAEEWPDSDKTMSLEDARYSVIRYLASPIPNAYGPQIHDPRSGEIIESHIGWYHNVIKLVHDWYMVQCGAIDERAHKMKFDDELMGQLIRFVSSHEVGHTLGLRHNFGASSLTPIDSLRSQEWLKEHGHTASIMDYARFNYVAQPEDNIDSTGIYPRINDYDVWAIEWGYRPMFDAYDAENDRWMLDKITTERLAANKRLWWGDGESSECQFDPRCQTEDLGDDVFKASNYGILNLKRIINELPKWTYDASDLSSSNLDRMYNAVQEQFLRYIGHVAKNIGGINYNFRTIDEKVQSYKDTPYEVQKKALDWINTNVLTEPNWLVTNEMRMRYSNHTIKSVTADIGVSAIGLLISRLGVTNSNYSGTAYLRDLESMLFSETKTKAPLTYFRRQMQKRYVYNLISNYSSISQLSSLRSTLFAALLRMKTVLNDASKTMSNEDDRAFFAELYNYVNNELEKKN